MAFVYIDHNILTRLVVERSAEPIGIQYRAIRDLLDDGDMTIVLSAVSLYEIARSNDEAHVMNSIALVGELSPRWLSNPVFLQTEELRRYVAGRSRQRIPRAFDAMNATMAQLWSTYDADAIIVGETVADCVMRLHRDRTAQRIVEAAALETLDAILTARRALAEGFLANNEMIIDADYYRTRLPLRTDMSFDISPRLYNDLPRLLAREGRRVRNACPAIKSEDLCHRYRIGAAFRPEAQDALDLQHVIGAMAYCDYFVTADNDIHGMFQHVRSRWHLCPCSAVRSFPELIEIVANN